MDGDTLATHLARYGYEITRERGSHLRLTTFRSGEHHLTIPRHRPLRVGTLAGILKAVAEHLDLDHGDVARELFS